VTGAASSSWTPPPAPPPRPSDWDRWAKEAEDARHESLKNARASAEKWTGTISALLGLFSTVAIVSGPDAIKDLGSGVVRWVAVAAIAVSGVLAGISVVVGAYAAQGRLVKLGNLDWDALEDHTVAETDGVRSKLKVSRATAVAAAITLLAAGLVVAASSAADAGKTASGSSVVIVDGSGGLRCGRLLVDGGTVKVGGQQVRDVRQVVPVGQC
jgi:hypothetical protein